MGVSSPTWLDETCKEATDMKKNAYQEVIQKRDTRSEKEEYR